MKTIRQIADEIGVSKTAVRKRLTPEVQTKFAQSVCGVIYISTEGETLIKQGFDHIIPQTKVCDSFRNQFADVSAVSSEVSGEVSTLITMLQKELDNKNKELDVKNEQIRELNARLAEKNAALVTAQQSTLFAQALHAGAIQKQLATDNIPSNKPEKQHIGFFARLFGRRV